MPSSACDWSSDVCSSDRSEEHTSELQSRSDLVCRLLLEKKKKKTMQINTDFSHHSTRTPQPTLCANIDLLRTMVIPTPRQTPTHTEPPLMNVLITPARST